MYIIAEIGFNHEGDMATAAKMIRAAAEAGADAVKFQTYMAIDLALPSAPHYEAIRCGEMDLEQHRELAKVARSCGVDFLSTPFSRLAFEILEDVGVAAYKVASMDCTNRHLLGLIAETGKPIYLSTGMATLAEIAESLEYLQVRKSGQVTLLHCLACYPAKAEELNLDIIPLLKKMFGVPAGYSDHFPGIKACLAAVMLGASVVETHFTIDCSKEGGDHVHSADPPMLKQLIADIALFNRMKGKSEAIYNRPDRRRAKDFRRGMYAARHIPKGEILKEEDLLFCRPTSSLSPNDIDRLKGKIVSKDIRPYQAIKDELLRD